MTNQRRGNPAWCSIFEMAPGLRQAERLVPFRQESYKLNPAPKARPGYAFTAPKVTGQDEDWMLVTNDEWDIFVLGRSELKGLEYKGIRIIDGSRSHVWHDRKRKRYVAQTAV